MRRSFAIGGRIVGQGRFPSTANTTFATRVESWSARAGPLATYEIAPHFSLMMFAGFGLDIVNVVAEVPTMAGIRITKPSLVALPAARLAVGAQAHGPIRLALWFEADIDVSGEKFYWLEGGRERTLFSTFVFRPGLLFEIGTP
jgi:hypothetical protein